MERPVLLGKSKDWVVVVTVSEWYDDMFQNWYFWYEALNLKMKVILVAEDSYIYEKYSNHSSLSVVSYGVEQIFDDKGKNMNYNSPGFNTLTSRRSSYLLKLMKIYPKIIYSDVDTVWKQDPRPFLKGDFDFWAQIDGVLEGQPYFYGYVPYICTGTNYCYILKGYSLLFLDVSDILNPIITFSGFLAMKSNAVNMNLMEKWHQETSKNIKENQDQRAFNKVVFEMNINFRVLPMKYFIPGYTYFEIMSDQTRKEAVFIHNNFLTGKDDKMKRFRWFNFLAPSLDSGMCILPIKN